MLSHISVAVLVGLIALIGAAFSGLISPDFTGKVIANTVIVLVIAVILSAVVSMFTARTMEKPLKKMMTAMERVAEGNFDVELGTPANDEIGSLMNSLQKLMEYIRGHAETAYKIAAGEENIEIKARSSQDLVAKSLQEIQNSLKKMVDELNAISRAHNAGDIDVMLPVDEFKGVYKQVAAGINEMVQSHINVKKKAMAAVAEFAKGNFDAELEKFPGKKAFINDHIEELRSNVKQFIYEMNRMSAEHDAGDIDVMLPVEKFSGDFRVMAEGVNKMVQGHINVKKKAMAVVAEFAKGNFDAKLEQFPGKKAFINDNIESLRKNLKEVNAEIHKLINASNEGKLDARANVHAFEGDWSKLMEGLNGLIDAILEPIGEAAEVLYELSKGNLQVRVTGDYKGDHAKIKNALNDSLETLASYVNEISTIVSEVADGNLDVAITRDYRGDFEQIKVSINYIIDKLNDMMAEINETSNRVAVGSKQLSDSSMALSQGATEQASSIEELTTSLEEVSAQTKKNAEYANDANKLAENAKNIAVRGNQQMQEMLTAMAEINEASNNISKIIKVIDDIAFQTNILSLNAAVEAARAGQHGKGFAVVAEEVRNLAARSANAAKETTDLIEGSIQKVEDGTKIANQTAEALNEIVEGVNEVAKIVDNIASASNEQAAAIEQINQGVMQISKVVQSNSVTSQEGAASSEELAAQAQLLRELVSQFRLRKQDKSNGVYQRAAVMRQDETQSSEQAEEDESLSPEGHIDGVIAELETENLLSDREFDKYSS